MNLLHTGEKTASMRLRKSSLVAEPSRGFPSWLCRVWLSPWPSGSALKQSVWKCLCWVLGPVSSEWSSSFLLLNDAVIWLHYYALRSFVTGGFYSWLFTCLPKKEAHLFPDGTPPCFSAVNVWYSQCVVSWDSSAFTLAHFPQVDKQLLCFHLPTQYLRKRIISLLIEEIERWWWY